VEQPTINIKDADMRAIRKDLNKVLGIKLGSELLNSS
jgi:hypothetical protein